MILVGGKPPAKKYKNVARSRDVISCTSKTTISGCPIWTEDSVIPFSEAPAGKPPGIGQKSGTWCSQATAKATCHTVTVEGQKVIRLGDPTKQNCNNCAGKVMTGAEADAMLAEADDEGTNSAIEDATQQPEPPEKPEQQTTAAEATQRGSSGTAATQPCPNACTITSQTTATSPANRARIRIGVGEEVELTVNPGPATWAITTGGSRGKLSPSVGSHTTVTFAANDVAGTVVITATAQGCNCTITFTVVEPASVTMERRAGTNLRHNYGRPDCGWSGTQWILPNDVNFYNIERREVDSRARATGSYNKFNGLRHGNYSSGFGSWFSIDMHDPVKGSRVAMADSIYSGDPGPSATRTVPPFKRGTMYFPIVYEWRVGTGTPHRFGAIRQEHEIFESGRCESRKGGHMEFTMYNDPTSTP